MFFSLIVKKFAVATRRKNTAVPFTSRCRLLLKLPEGLTGNKSFGTFFVQCCEPMFRVVVLCFPLNRERNFPAASLWACSQSNSFKTCIIGKWFSWKREAIQGNKKKAKNLQCRLSFFLIARSKRRKLFHFSTVRTKRKKTLLPLTE